MKSNSAPLTLLLSVIVAAGCGGRESAASKSAAEFDREQQKGGPTPATGGAHGGHLAGQEADHSNMPGMKPAKGAPPAAGSMAGMDHSNMPGMTMAPPLPEIPAVSAQPGQPAATLRIGDLDVPAPTSVRDAARSAAMAQAMAGGHGGMTHGTYSQTDAGREATAPSDGTMAPGHGGHSPGTSAPEADPHQMHSAPARPQPSPSAGPSPKRTTAQPTPAADPHSMHGQPASPRPQPSPGAKENKE